MHLIAFDLKMFFYRQTHRQTLADRRTDSQKARLRELVSWSARGFDTRIGDVERVRTRLLKGVRVGAILLMHDGNAARTTDGVPVILDVLPKILSAAADANLRFVTLPQALA